MPALPLIAAGISLATTAIGGIMGAAGAQTQAQAQAQTANYQAQVARNNQIIAQQQAEAAVQTGQEQATEQGLRNRAQLGGILAAQSASGLDVTTGSAPEVRSSAREIGQLEQTTIEHNAALQAYGYQTQATSQAAQAGLLSLEAQQARQAGTIGVATSLVSGASNLGSKFIQFQNSGIFGGSAGPNQLYGNPANLGT